MESGNTEAKFESWAVLELMGHRKLGGFVQEVSLAGVGMIRIDVPKVGAPEGSREWVATQFYSPSSLYALTPVTEKMARAVAARSQPEPVTRWELPAETKSSGSAEEVENFRDDE